MKGIKRDVTTFPILKNDEHWDAWNRQLIATSRMQDVADVLDEHYTPFTTEERDLFIAKQEFMYTVFERTILTSQGKDLICKHENDFNAQLIYKELLLYLKTSTKGLMTASNILAYLTTARLTPESLKGTTQDFILH